MMLFNALFLLTILPLYILARPVPHGSAQQRRSHKLIRDSLNSRHASEAASVLSMRSSKSGSTDDNADSTSNSTETASSKNKTPSGGDIMNALFPTGVGSSTWSTCPQVDGAVDLTMASFNSKEVMASAQPKFSKAPDGSQALQIHFNKGSYDYKGPQGGISFYAQPLELSHAKEVVSSYMIQFSEGFDYNKGGKIPGLYGGHDGTAESCSGGRRDNSCWSARFMFRPGGDGELYTYLGPDGAGNQQVCDVKPMSTCNDKYGASVARGAWKWKTDAWTLVTQRIKLNTVGKADGEIEVIIDGKTVINLSGLTLCDNKQCKHQGMQMQSFFGGHEPEWASPQDQDIYMKDFSITVTETL